MMCPYMTALPESVRISLTHLFSAVSEQWSYV